ERFPTAMEFRHALLDWLHVTGDATTELEIATALDDAFGVKRREMQSRIEAQIRLTRESPSSSSTALASVPRLSSDSIVTAPTPISGATAMSDAPIAPTLPPPMPPPRSRLGTIALALVAG